MTRTVDVKHPKAVAELVKSLGPKLRGINVATVTVSRLVKPDSPQVADTGVANDHGDTMMSTPITRNALQKRNPFAMPLFQLATVLRAAGNYLRVAATRLNARLERHHVAAESLQALHEMTDRDLRDIGLTRFDVENAARDVSSLDAHPRYVPHD